MGRAPGRDHEAVLDLSERVSRVSRWRFTTEDAYGLLLAIIVVTFMLLSQVEPGRWSRLVVAPAVGAMLLLALFASRARPQLMRAAVIAIGVSYVFLIGESALDSEVLGGSIYLIYAALLTITPVVIINRILRHPEVQVSTILGAVCAYMLIGMVFGFVYGLIGRIDPPFFAGKPVVDQFDYLYFSYACITTVGFGDFTARGDLGRSLSVLEAVLGQIFLVTLIARLVSQFGQRRDTGTTPSE